MLLIGHSILGIALGAVMCWAGRRGRRIDRRAVCRRCTFDLSARGPFDSRCPECGLNLFKWRSIVRGRRTPMPLLAIAGAIILGISLLHGAMWGMPEALNLNWNSHKPTTLLIAEANAGSTAMRTGALRELAARLKRSALATSENRRFVDAAFADAEVSPDRLWHPAAHEALAEAHRQGLLSPEEVVRVARAALQLNFERRYAPYAIELHAGCAKEFSDELILHLELLPAEVVDRDNKRVETIWPRTSAWISASSGLEQFHCRIEERNWRGPLTVTLPVRVLVYDRNSLDAPIGQWQENVTPADNQQ
jgi:hypothetical protein